MVRGLTDLLIIDLDLILQVFIKNMIASASQKDSSLIMIPADGVFTTTDGGEPQGTLSRILKFADN